MQSKCNLLWSVAWGENPYATTSHAVKLPHPEDVARGLRNPTRAVTLHTCTASTKKERIQTRETKKEKKTLYGRVSILHHAIHCSLTLAEQSRAASTYHWTKVDPNGIQWHQYLPQAQYFNSRDGGSNQLLFRTGQLSRAD